jgi:hypothetical protein
LPGRRAVRRALCRRAPPPAGAIAADPALIGSYRRAIGWGKDRQPTAALDASFELLRRAP